MEPVHDEPVALGSGVHWVGYNDPSRNLHCNPYLIVEGDEAVVIDSGSRADFQHVFLKILQTGIEPSMINRLIYHHYDPDLCAGIPVLEEVVDNDDLKIISHKENNVFIRYYMVSSPLLCITTMDYSWSFKTGRTLRFYTTPYAHAPGSFMTYDELSGTLFTSDLFGSYNVDWTLFAGFHENCDIHKGARECGTFSNEKCQLYGLVDLHRRLMPSNRALKHALDVVEEIEPGMICPQHGSIIDKKADMRMVIKTLRNHDAGIDSIFAQTPSEA